MDLPVCPSCHQSVIDDEAEDCPFCGTSMKAKPNPKPVASPVKPSTTASKPAPVKPAKPQPTLPGDDFPFEAELTTGKSAIQAMPNPTKQRTWKVICPMCDTPGYLPTTAAGQEVRCSNTKCVMPVFTAPAPKKEVAAPPPPPPKSNPLPMIIAATVVVMLAIGGGMYTFNALPNNNKGAGKGLSDEAREVLAEMNAGKKPIAPANPDPKGASDNQNKAGGPDKPTTVERSAEDRIRDALQLMRDSCLEKNKQRSKPYCRQLSAEANAVAGHAEAAREHLNQLLKVGNEVSYYRIIPLLDLFWGEFAAGEKKAATNTLNIAMSEVPKIPKFGRTRLDIAGRLAAAPVAAGRIPDAKKVLTEIQSAELEAQLAAQLQMAMDGHLVPLSDLHSVLPWQFPQAVAATASLIARGQLDVAAAWAVDQDSERAKAECLAIWAETFAETNAPAGSADSESAIADATKSLSPAMAARVWARAGCGRFAAQDALGTAEAIKRAQDLMSTIHVPERIVMPNVKTILRFKLPAATPLLEAATAMGEIAYVQALSAATKADAEKSLDAALAFADGVAPSATAARQLQEEADRRGPAGLRAYLKNELKLKSDDESRTAASNYKRIVNEILEAAKDRFEIQTQTLLRLRSAGVGLNSKVWIVTNARTTTDDLNQRDDFFATRLPSELIEGLKGTDEEKAILGAWSLRSKNSAPPRPVDLEFNQRLSSDVPGAVKFLLKALPKSNGREEILLRTTSRLAADKQISTVFQLIAELDDIVIREECYRLASGLATQRGQVNAVWDQVGIVTEQTEKVAICRGLVAGLAAELTAK